MHINEVQQMIEVSRTEMLLLLMERIRTGMEELQLESEHLMILHRAIHLTAIELVIQEPGDDT